MISGFIVSGTNKYELFSVGKPGAEVTSCTATFSLNAVDSAEVTIPRTNAKANAVLQKNAVVELQNDDAVVFRGDIGSATQNIDGSVTLELDGALGFMRSICKPPFQINSASANKAVGDFLTAIISQYNAAVPVERMLQLGTVTVTGDLRMDHEEEYTSMLDLVQEVLEQLGGYLYMDYASTPPALNYVAQPSDVSEQVLEVGVNVLTAENQLDFTDYASRVYATGSYYVTTTQDGKEVRSSVPLDAGYVVDSDAETAFGRQDITYQSRTDMGGNKDNNVPDKTRAEAEAIILAEAQAILNERKTPLQSLTMTAVDLAEIGYKFRLFTLGTTVRALCPTINIDAQMLVKSIKRDYVDKTNSSVVLGREPRMLTGMIGGSSSSSVIGGGGGSAVISGVSSVNGQTGDVVLSIPSKTSDLTNDSGYITDADIPEGAAASTSLPLMDGTAATGTSNAFARGDHVHPSDTTKVDKETGKGLSTNDYTTSEKTKLSGIESGAEVNIIETVRVNGTALEVTNKAVDVTVPTPTTPYTIVVNYNSSTDTYTLGGSVTAANILANASNCVLQINTGGNANYVYPEEYYATSTACTIYFPRVKCDVAQYAGAEIREIRISVRNGNAIVEAYETKAPDIPWPTNENEGKILKAVNNVWTAVPESSGSSQLVVSVTESNGTYSVSGVTAAQINSNRDNIVIDFRNQHYVSQGYIYEANQCTIQFVKDDIGDAYNERDGFILTANTTSGTATVVHVFI